MRDQTLVNRLVELGTLTEEEAETDPRRNELQQAVGGQPDVEPGVYSAARSRATFIIVCSDGLSNHVKKCSFVSSCTATMAFGRASGAAADEPGEHRGGH